MSEKSWHVVAYEDADKECLDDPDCAIWTLSLDPDEPGWNTDGGYDGYGLTKALAEELANAANAVAKRERIMPYPSDLEIDVVILRGNEVFVLSQVTDETMNNLDGTRVGLPAVFSFHNDKIRVWPTPAKDETFEFKIRNTP